jgi:hypothetical protein
VTIAPIDFATKFGSFRLINARQLNTYVNGRFYDPVFYAPKDSAVLSPSNRCMTRRTSSSTRQAALLLELRPLAAAMFSPDVFGLNKSTNKYLHPAVHDAERFPSPAHVAASYGNLKSHVDRAPLAPEPQEDLQSGLRRQRHL